MKIKETIAMILIATALIGAVVASIWSIVFNIQHPDMTQMRLMMENPGPIITIFICLTMYIIGTHMLSHRRRRK